MDLRLMHTVGHLALLDERKVAFLCSRSCPAAVRERALAWAGKMRQCGACVISGFHSRIEKEVLYHLLQGPQPIILVLARGLGRELPPELSEPLEKERLLVLTRYAESVTHPSEESCYQRNRLMMELADEIVVAHAAPGGKLEKLCAEFCGVKSIRHLDGAAGDRGALPAAP